MQAAWIALALSLKVALWATALNLLAGVAVGWWMAHRRFLGREVVDAALTLPMVMPPTVLGYYLLLLIGSHGAVGARGCCRHFGIRLIFTWQAAVIAATIVVLSARLQGGACGLRDGGPAAGGRRAHTGHQRAGRCSCACRCRWPGAASWPGCCWPLRVPPGEFGATLMVARQHRRQDADAVDRRL